MSGLARIWLIVLTATTLASRRRPNMECHGFWSVAKALPADPKQRNASGTTKLDAVETSSTNHGRAVAAATGRGFKSHQPDKIIFNRINLSKAGWSWGCVSATDSKGERSGLQMRIAAESVSLCVRMKSWWLLWNWKRRLRRSSR